MSDRNSAGIFSAVFEKLASDRTDQHIKWALDFWDLQHEYDFSPDQMECNQALVELGLARRGIDPDYPNDGETWLYGPQAPNPKDTMIAFTVNGREYHLEQPEITYEAICELAKTSTGATVTWMCRDANLPTGTTCGTLTRGAAIALRPNMRFDCYPTGAA